MKTSSGATAVQIAQKLRGIRTIIEHVGSAHTDAEVASLMLVARNRIHSGQATFDLDALTPAPETAPVTVVDSSSRVLWDVLCAAYTRLGFDVVADASFKKLVLARIVEPTSKVDTIRVLTEMGIPAPSLRTIWRTLARCIEHDWRDQIAKAGYQFRAHTGGIGLILYDVTTLYFEAEHEDELRKVGFSKERRVDPQVVIGLLVDSEGWAVSSSVDTLFTFQAATAV